MKIEITDVQRLALKPGDRIIVRTPERLDMTTADRVEQVVRGKLGLGPDVPVLVLPEGMSLEAADGPPPGDLEITR